MNSDRRQYSRCEPENLVYAQFGKANGGLVINASLGGLHFQTVAPTQASNVVELTVSPSAKESIGLTGKIVWTDDSGKMGGLEFVDPAPDVKARLKNWLLPQMSKEKEDARRNQDDLSKDSQRPAVALPGSSSPDVTPAAAPIFELPASYRSRSNVPRMFGSITGAAELFENASQINVRRPKHRLLRGVANLIIIALLLLLPAAYIYNFHPQLANSLIDRAMELYSGTDAPKTAAPPQTGAPPNELSPVAPPTAAPPELAKDNPINSGVAPSSELPSEHAAPTVPAEKTLPAAEKPATSLGAARGVASRTERLRKISHPRLPVDPNDPNELWLAVGQGDADAEVALARLYMTGRLVKKNCEQARILLTAASKKGNAEAITELRELLRKGCK